MSNDFKTLGISFTASKEEIRLAYIKKMYEHREGTEAHENVQIIRDAYINIVKGYNNIHLISLHTKEEVIRGITCRCGCIYNIQNINAERIECDGCSCFVEII